MSRENHGIPHCFGSEGTLKVIQFHPCHSRDTSHGPRVFRAPSSLALGNSRDPGAPTASLGRQSSEDTVLEPKPTLVGKAVPKETAPASTAKNGGGRRGMWWKGILASVPPSQHGVCCNSDSSELWELHPCVTEQGGYSTGLPQGYGYSYSSWKWHRGTPIPSLAWGWGLSRNRPSHSPSTTQAGKCPQGPRVRAVPDPPWHPERGTECHGQSLNPKQNSLS